MRLSLSFARKVSFQISTMADEISVHDDSDKPIRTAFAVTSARVEHYSDVVEFMARDAVERYVQKHKKQPRPSQVEFLKKELTRYAIIRHDVQTAQTLSISDTDLLLESGSLSG